MPRAPLSYWIIAIALLLWNAAGAYAYITQASMDLNALARTDPEGARIFAAMPQWVWTVYSFAVAAGIAGAITLIMRRRAAGWLFALSLICVILQFGYSLLGTELLALKGASAAIFPLVIIAIAACSTLWAYHCRDKGLLR